MKDDSFEVRQGEGSVQWLPFKLQKAEFKESSQTITERALKIKEHGTDRVPIKFSWL